jgi:hypothetical protein
MTSVYEYDILLLLHPLLPCGGGRFSRTRLLPCGITVTTMKMSWEVNRWTFSPEVKTVYSICFFYFWVKGCELLEWAYLEENKTLFHLGLAFRGSVWLYAALTSATLVLYGITIPHLILSLIQFGLFLLSLLTLK